MLISEFDYNLPEDLIAQNPLQDRETSRMLVADRKNETTRDDQFSNLPKFLNKGDLLVLNNTKVFPARLIGTTDTGAKVELFLVNELSPGKWDVLGKPLKRLKPGKEIEFGKGFSAKVAARKEAALEVEFSDEGVFYDLLDKYGKVPLPPYVQRDSQAADTEEDRLRYQTVYAKERGAIAAPTAGLHFTPSVIEELTKKGVEIVEITLHVGYGTFEPVRVSELSEHSVKPECYEISEVAAEKLNRARSESRRIIAVGTTTTRALEDSWAKHNRIISGKQMAVLTILPGFEFRVIEALLTNFHLPKSSLLVLVSTFGGHVFIRRAYERAVREAYRFYSYGDCMFIHG